MKTDCSTDRYAQLYAPWLETADDFAARFIEPRDRVLDLCGGTGRVAQKAWDMGCQAVAVLDVNPRVIPPWESIKVQRGDGHFPQDHFGPHSFDVVVCRQAIGYMDLEPLAHGVRKVLAPAGRFCFNNFRKPRWFWKRYEYRNSRYSELGWYFGRTCWHIQRRVGEGWDLTKFRWHTHDEIVEEFSKYFDVRVERTEKTNYYTCVIRDF